MMMLRYNYICFKALFCIANFDYQNRFQVFILQLEGRKHWRLYAPPTSLPQEYSCDLKSADIGEPTHDFILEVRGCQHLTFFPFLHFVFVLQLLPSFPSTLSRLGTCFISHGVQSIKLTHQLACVTPPISLLAPISISEKWVNVCMKFSNRMQYKFN